ETMVFPAHDYKGETVSTIGEEKAFNPRLQVKSIDEYADLMSRLNLPNPKMMDVAVPANMRVGLAQAEIARRGWAMSATEAMPLAGTPNVTLGDLRERTEREKHGVIPGSLHAPYPDLAANVRPGGMLHELARATGKRIVFYCAFGERSAMAVQAAQDAGLTSACHIQGGIDALKKADGPLLRYDQPIRLPSVSTSCPRIAHRKRPVNALMSRGPSPSSNPTVGSGGCRNRTQSKHGTGIRDACSCQPE